MKQVYVALTFASALFALAGAIFFVCSVDSSREASKASLARVQASTAALEGKLKAVIERVESMEKDFSRLQVRAARATGGTAEEPEPETSSMTEGRASWKEKRQALALLLSDQEADDLRSFVEQVIKDGRKEGIEAEGRRGEDEGRELETLDKELYGKFTYRVNSLATKLDLNESQKERYHALLSDYCARIEENRNGLNRDDPIAYKAYRERKQQTIAEFDGLVAQTLTPQQTQEYQKLSPHERSPALEHATRAPVTTGGNSPQGGSTRAEGAVPRQEGNAEAESRSSTKGLSR